MPASRPSARQRGYTPRWERARASYLLAHPWCARCAQEGKRVAARHVDHIKPHRGDQRLFWDPKNRQGLCDDHHNSEKQVIEKRGYSDRLGADGLPIDPNHPFYRSAETAPIGGINRRDRPVLSCSGLELTPFEVPQPVRAPNGLTLDHPGVRDASFRSDMPIDGRPLLARVRWG